MNHYSTFFPAGWRFWPVHSWLCRPPQTFHNEKPTKTIYYLENKGSRSYGIEIFLYFDRREIRVMFVIQLFH